jgi:undecaprenyl pyrophosphate phosphatase UppP
MDMQLFNLVLVITTIASVLIMYQKTNLEAINQQTLSFPSSPASWKQPLILSLSITVIICIKGIASYLVGQKPIAQKLETLFFLLLTFIYK